MHHQTFSIWICNREVGILEYFQNKTDDMKHLFIFFISFFIFSCVSYAQKTFYNVRDYGAKGDSMSIDTRAINDAIDAAASKGGGTVYFPAGIYASYSIRLKSNIC